MHGSCLQLDWTTTVALYYSTNIPVLPVSMVPRIMLEKLLSAKEIVAYIFQEYRVIIDVATVRKWSTRGVGGAQLPRVQIGGRHFVKLSRLRPWLQRSQLKSLACCSRTSR